MIVSIVTKTQKVSEIVDMILKELVNFGTQFSHEEGFVGIFPFPLSDTRTALRIEVPFIEDEELQKAQVQWMQKFLTSYSNGDNADPDLILATIQTGPQQTLMSEAAQQRVREASSKSSGTSSNLH